MCNGDVRGENWGKKVRAVVAKSNSSGSFDSVSRDETARDCAQDDIFCGHKGLVVFAEEVTQMVESVGAVAGFYVEQDLGGGELVAEVVGG
jgi:hypothetical protein